MARSGRSVKPPDSVGSVLRSAPRRRDQHRADRARGDLLDLRQRVARDARRRALLQLGGAVEDQARSSSVYRRSATDVVFVGAAGRSGGGQDTE
jgi:hypothetical protein